MATAQSENVVLLSPDTVLADDNSRFGLKDTRKESLKQSILDSGGVLVPVEVSPLKPPVNGFQYRLTSGFYRHAAVAELNKEQGAGLMLPAIIREVDDKTRLMHQLSENMERENQSPMDQAVAIQKLMDAGMSRKQIRDIFARPVGRKGLQLQPASNAWVNITLRLLELPKTVQQKVHEGRISFAAAYELGRVTPERRQAVLDRAEAEAARFEEQEKKDEEKYLNEEKKLIAAETKAKDSEKAAEAGKTDVELARQLVSEKTAALRLIQKEPWLELDDAGKKALSEKLKAAETDVKGAQKVLKDAENKVAKELTKAKTAAEVAAEHRKKLEDQRKALKTKKGPGPVGPKDVKKAAKAEGVAEGAVQLNASEMRQVVKDISKSEHEKVAALGQILLACFNGGPTTKETIHELAVITGEEKGTATPPTTVKQPVTRLKPTAKPA